EQLGAALVVGVIRAPAVILELQGLGIESVGLDDVGVALQVGVRDVKLEAVGVLRDAVEAAQLIFGPLGAFGVAGLEIMSAEGFEGFLVITAHDQDALDQFEVARADGRRLDRTGRGLSPHCRKHARSEYAHRHRIAPKHNVAFPSSVSADQNLNPEGPQSPRSQTAFGNTRSRNSVSAKRPRTQGSSPGGETEFRGPAFPNGVWERGGTKRGRRSRNPKRVGFFLVWLPVNPA